MSLLLLKWKGRKKGNERWRGNYEERKCKGGRLNRLEGGRIIRDVTHSDNNIRFDRAENVDMEKCSEETMILFNS